jgi:hypothetical protein
LRREQPAQCEKLQPAGKAFTWPANGVTMIVACAMAVSFDPARVAFTAPSLSAT